MKSITNQYRDLQEGRMSQGNFMRNLRMTFPQYVTNVTSFNDAVKILKNKGILTEAKGKDLHPNQIHPQELRMGIQVEMEHTDDLEKAKKIALDHLAENPFYYTQLKLSGVDTQALPSKEKKAVAKKKDQTELVDKANQMKTPKGVEKIKASANKAHKETNKGVKGVQELTHTAKKAKGIKQVMSPTGGKMKTIKEHIYDREGQIEFIEKSGNYNGTLDDKSDEEIQKIYDTVERISLQKKNSGVDLGASFDKFKSQLREVIRKVINEEIK